MKTKYRKENPESFTDADIWDIQTEVDLDDLARVSGLDLLNSQESE